MDLKPAAGHCLLLMEPQPDQRTFSDYPNRETCCDALLNLYEKSANFVLAYTLDDIWQWLAQFKQITLFVFDEELARYRKLTSSQFKELFITAIQRASQ